MASSTPATVRQLGAALRVLLALTVVLGLAYPLAMTGVSALLFRDQAGGSLVEVNGQVVGSSIIGQSFTREVTENGAPVTDPDGNPVTAPDPAYFQSRPSAAGDGYDPTSSSASNLGAENPELADLVRARHAEVAALEGIEGTVASDALLASGSGLDPHISPEYAAQQVTRVARERGVAPEQVGRLVQEHTEGRAFGFLGEPHVNVLLLNLDLDRLTGMPAAAAARVGWRVGLAG